MTQREKLAYIAGFFDGEGCISGYTNHRGIRHVTVSIGQKRREPLDFIQATLGIGAVTKVRTRESYQYNLCGRYNIRMFLRLLLPYLIVKHKEAIVALAILKVGASRAPQSQFDELRRLKRGPT